VRAFVDLASQAVRDDPLLQPSRGVD